MAMPTFFLPSSPIDFLMSPVMPLACTMTEAMGGNSPTPHHRGCRWVRRWGQNWASILGFRPLPTQLEPHVRSNVSLATYA